MRAANIRNKVYREERAVLLAALQTRSPLGRPKRLAYCEAIELASQLLGEPVHIVSTEGVPAGIIAFGNWIDTSLGRLAVIGVQDPDSVNDLVIAHEVGHLAADRDGISKDHGPEWLDAYCTALEDMGRGRLAGEMRRRVGDVLVMA